MRLPYLFGHFILANKVSEPTEIELPTAATLIGCGRNHTLIALDDGRLMACGSNQDGQLGNENGEDSAIPIPVKIKRPSSSWVAVSCGTEHSAALTANGAVWTWGENAAGQLGSAKATGPPQKLRLKFKVVAIACGGYHSALLTDTGELYTFGENDTGKLGLGDEVDGT